MVARRLTVVMALLSLLGLGCGEGEKKANAYMPAVEKALKEAYREVGTVDAETVALAQSKLKEPRIRLMVRDDLKTKKGEDKGKEGWRRLRSDNTATVVLLPHYPQQVLLFVTGGVKDGEGGRFFRCRLINLGESGLPESPILKSNEYDDENDDEKFRKMRDGCLNQADDVGKYRMRTISSQLATRFTANEVPSSSELAEAFAEINRQTPSGGLTIKASQAAPAHFQPSETRKVRWTLEALMPSGATYRLHQLSSGSEWRTCAPYGKGSCQRPKRYTVQEW